MISIELYNNFGELNGSGLIDIDPKEQLQIIKQISDISEFGSKKGTSSYQYKVPGTKNNNIKLNNYYNINISDGGSFDRNKIQRAVLKKDGINIIDGLLQLTKVLIDGEDNLVSEYEIIIKKDELDFFTKTNQLELSNIKLDYLNHTFSQTSINSIMFGSASQYINKIMYIPGLTSEDQYRMSELLLCVYGKEYWDKIHSDAGYQYEWNSLTSSNIKFDKTLIPFNGDSVNFNDFYTNEYKTLITSSYSLTFSSIGITGSFASQKSDLNFDVILQDNLNQFNITDQEFIAELQTNYQITIDVTYRLKVINGNTFSVYVKSLNNNGVFRAYPVVGFIKNGLDISYTYNSIKPVSNPLQYSFDSNFVFSPGTNIIQDTVSNQLTMPAQNLNINDVLKFKFGVQVNSYQFPRLKVSNSFSAMDAANVTFRLELDSITLGISPLLTEIPNNGYVQVSKYIPEKIKQSDFIKSIMNLYNLYYEIDEETKKIVYSTRDDYYDSGRIKNDLKLDTSKDPDITWISDSQTKRTILTYKDDKDFYNVSYKDNTKETYGQYEFIFSSENIKDISRKELIFSPTPYVKTNFGAYVSTISGISPKNNIRILLDGGIKQTDSPYYIYIGSNFYTLNEYRQATHFDDVLTPNLDLNYGTNTAFFSSPGYLTRNEMYNSHYRRTFSQLDKGRKMTVYAIMDEFEIQDIRMNDKIHLRNSYWYYNKILINLNDNSPVKIELIEAEDDLLISSADTRDGFETTPNIPWIGSANSNSIKDKDNQSTIHFGLDNNISVGHNNIIRNDSRNTIVIGDKGDIGNTKNTLIIGDNIPYSENGFENAVVSENVYLENINDIPFSDIQEILQGDFCATGITVSDIRACSGEGYIKFLNNGAGESIYMGMTTSNNLQYNFIVDPMTNGILTMDTRDLNTNDHGYFLLNPLTSRLVIDSMSFSTTIQLGDKFIDNYVSDLVTGESQDFLIKSTGIELYPSGTASIFISTPFNINNTNTDILSRNSITGLIETINSSTLVPDFCANGITVSNIRSCDGTVGITMSSNKTKIYSNGLEYGGGNTASGLYSVALGINNISTGANSVSMNDTNLASGLSSFASGFNTKAFGDYSHTEGYITNANNVGAHAEGANTQAIGFASHAEGYITQATGFGSHVEGVFSVAVGTSAHAEGVSTLATGLYSHTEGESTTTNGTGSHAEGGFTLASGLYSHSEGFGNTSSEVGSHAEGWNTKASGLASHAEGRNNLSSGDYSHSTGIGNIVSGYSSLVGGISSTSSGFASFAFGENTLSNNKGSVALGSNTESTGEYTTSFGYKNKSYGDYSISGGRDNASLLYGAISLGGFNIANGTFSFVSGRMNNSISENSFIAGGFFHSVTASGINNFIGGGQANRISEGSNNSTLGGNNNNVELANNNSIIGGNSNNIYGGSCVILASTNCTISASGSNTSILGGQNITATESNTSYVPSLFLKGRFCVNQVQVTATSSLVNDISTVFGTLAASFTTTMPSLAVNGQRIKFRRKDNTGSTWTIAPNSGQNINRVGVLGSTTLSGNLKIEFEFDNGIWYDV